MSSARPAEHRAWRAEPRGFVAEVAIQLPVFIASFGVLADCRFLEEQRIGVAEEHPGRLPSARPELLVELGGRAPARPGRTEQGAQSAACGREGDTANGLAPTGEHAPRLPGLHHVLSHESRIALLMPVRQGELSRLAVTAVIATHDKCQLPELATGYLGDQRGVEVPSHRKGSSSNAARSHSPSTAAAS